MKKSGGLLAFSLLAALSARAVILLDTGDPTVNTTAPAGALADSGWQYQGDWGGWLGTPISPNFFVSAAHLGQASDHISFQGSSYQIVQSFSLPGSDLLIWQVQGIFPYFAPLYTRQDETGQHLVVIGRGTERGSEVILNGTLRGWNWGNDTDVRRWGENDIAEIIPYGGHDLLYATFDQHATFDEQGQPTDRPHECHLSRNDSGGAVFLNDNGAWKLAAINFAVDDLYTAPSTSAQFLAAIFDARGYYSYDGTNFNQISGPSPVPTGFYGSRISSELAWICSVIADPQVGREGNFLTLTYSKLLAPASNIVYTVQTSDNLAGWQPANTADETISVAGDIAKIKAKIDTGMATHLFARLLVTRP
ncbi:MAG: hypothetical protein QOG67_715 [Verrucomicrobiota bacterium]|jgi:hypothetical protein